MQRQWICSSKPQSSKKPTASLFAHGIGFLFFFLILMESINR